jgi:TolA-binding protein
MIKNLLLLVVLFGCLPACLQTRAQLRDSPQGSKIESKPIVFAQNGKITGNSSNATSAPAAAPQISKEAQTDSRFEDVNKDFRQLYGKVETVENQMNQLKENKALEEKIAQLEGKIALLETTVVDLNSKSKKEPAAPVAKSASTKVDKNELAAADQFYSEKKWEDAILAYEDFRKQNPKGKSYAEATYKIGVCFQNLGMKDDAKAFFKEVVDKYPSAKEAGLAKSKLKKI